MIPLDGGRAAFLVLRRILGSHYPERLGRVLTYAGLGALPGVFVIANGADVYHLLFGGGVFDMLAHK